MWILLILWVVNGDIDFSYRIQPNQEVCEVRKEFALKYVPTYHNNLEHLEITCLKLEE